MLGSERIYTSFDLDAGGKSSCCKKSRTSPKQLSAAPLENSSTTEWLSRMEKLAVSDLSKPTYFYGSLRREQSNTFATGVMLTNVIKCVEKHPISVTLG